MSAEIPLIRKWLETLDIQSRRLPYARGRIARDVSRHVAVPVSVCFPPKSI